MQRLWVRATRDRFCGYCPARPIRRGEPMLEMRLVGVTRAFIRCPQCAGESVPADLPPLAEPLHAGDFTQLVEAATAPREWLPYRDDEDR